MFPIPYPYYTLLDKNYNTGLIDKKSHDGVDEAKDKTRAEGAPEAHFYTRQKVNCQNYHGGIDN